MKKLFEYESRIKMILLLAILSTFSYGMIYYDIRKEPWETETESIVRKNLPIGNHDCKSKDGL